MLENAGFKKYSNPSTSSAVKRTSSHEIAYSFKKGDNKNA